MKGQKERYNDATADRTAREELETLRIERDAYRERYGDFEKDVSKTIRFNIPQQPSERLAAVVFCDMIGSTGSVVGMDFHQRGVVLNEFVKLAKQMVTECRGFFDKFTGDGLLALFGVEHEATLGGSFDEKLVSDSCRRAWVFAQKMNAAMTEFNNKPEIFGVLQRNTGVVQSFELRIAASAGNVLFGSFGGPGTAVGVPVILAARLCAEKEAFKKAQTSILVDNSFQTRSGISEFKEVDYEFLPKGFPGAVRIFRAQPRM